MPIALKIIIAFCLAIYAPLTVNASEVSPIPETPKTLDELKVAIEKIRTETHTPAVGIALVNDKGPLWVASLGEANSEKHIKADEDTMYRIGSVSKMFVALAVQKLVEEGKLHLNDKVRNLVPDVAFNNPWEDMHPILLVHLLEHTTGWDDMHLAEYAHNQSTPINLKEALEFHPDSRTSRWIPGTRHAYCNTGPAVTAYIIERVTGQKFEDYIQQNFFNPLQMHTATYFLSAAYQQHAATLYSGIKPEKYWNIIYRPAGAINASPKDMANFLQFLIKRGEFEGKRIISNESFDRTEVSKTTLGGEVGLTAGYGLHNYTTGRKGFAFHGHNGGVIGGLTELSYLREKNVGYVFMINSDNGVAFQKISDLIRDYLLQNLKAPESKTINLPEEFKLLTGWYKPINPRSDLLKYLLDVVGLLHITLTDGELHSSPLTAPWQSNYGAINHTYLVDKWTGLATLARVKDPLAGETVQIDTTLYQRISPFHVFGLLALFILWSLVMVVDFIFAFFWIPRRVWGKLQGGPSIQLRIWPLISSGLILLATFSGIIFGGNASTLESWGTLSMVSVNLFVASIAFCLTSIWSLWLAIRYYKQPIYKLAYWHSTLLASLHVGVMIYLLYYGAIGIRTWVY